MANKMHSMHISRVLIMVALVISVALFCSAPVYAFDNVTLTVSQSFNKTGEIPGGFDGSRDYILTAADPGNPMPAKSAGGEYRFTLKEDDELVFTTSTGGPVSEPALYFTHAGVYEYTVQPLTAEPDSRYEFEDTVYTVRIYVENNASGENGLRVMRIVCDNNQGEKPDYIRYHCSFTGKAPSGETEKSSGIKTGDTSNIAIWISVLAMSIIMLMVILLRRRRGDKEDRKK